MADPRFSVDVHGHVVDVPDIAGMMSPVECTHCGGVYDMGTVEVIARYTDCSVWKAPCCGLTVDDRGLTGWTTRSDVRSLR